MNEKLELATLKQIMKQRWIPLRKVRLRKFMGRFQRNLEL